MGVTPHLRFESVFLGDAVNSWPTQLQLMEQAAAHLRSCHMILLLTVEARLAG